MPLMVKPLVRRNQSQFDTISLQNSEAIKVIIKPRKRSLMPLSELETPKDHEY
jgi:hypothetical protein